MIPLKHLAENAVLQGQSYDLNKDFFDFKRMLDGNDELIKRKFEGLINSKLVGKRIRARAARGYKQFEKDYEFDVSRITIDDYYDNYVVIAHDDSNPRKSKEYFLRPGFRIQILGLASGKNPTQTPKGEHQPTPKVFASPEEVPPQERNSVPVKEGDSHYDAYPLDNIINDIKKWIPYLLNTSGGELRQFIKGLGWIKHLNKGGIAMYDLKLPLEDLKQRLDKNIIFQILSRINTPETKYELRSIDFDKDKKEYSLRIKKTMTGTQPL